MNAREIVRQTLEFESPLRVARSFCAPDLLEAGHTVRTCATDWRPVSPGRYERLDEWGNIWQRTNVSSRGEVVQAVLRELADMDDYEFPDFSNPADYQAARQRRNENMDKWVYGLLPGFAFNIARNVRRFDAYLIDLIESPDRIAALHDRIDFMLEQMIRNYAATGLDGIFFCEDWGTQTQMMINPARWRQEFRPRFEKLCGIAHQYKLKVVMHSCGRIEAIVEDLINSGIDILQFDQPDLHGIATLARYQKRYKITFWCPVDIQKALPTGNEWLIRAKAREMLNKLWRGRGGFIAGYYSDNSSIGTDPRWQEWACDEFLQYGRDSNFSPP